MLLIFPLLLLSLPLEPPSADAAPIVATPPAMQA